MRRLLLAIGVAAVLAGAVYGAAATLGGINAGQLGADTSVVASCDTDGVGFRWAGIGGTPTGHTLSTASVTDIAAACTGHFVLTELRRSDGTLIATAAPAAVSGSSVAVAFTPPAPIAEIAQVNIAIVQ